MRVWVFTWVYARASTSTRRGLPSPRARADRWCPHTAVGRRAEATPGPRPHPQLGPPAPPTAGARPHRGPPSPRARSSHSRGVPTPVRRHTGSRPRPSRPWKTAGGRACQCVAAPGHAAASATQLRLRCSSDTPVLVQTLRRRRHHRSGVLLTCTTYRRRTGSRVKKQVSSMSWRRDRKANGEARTGRGRAAHLLQSAGQQARWNGGTRGVFIHAASLFLCGVGLRRRRSSPQAPSDTEQRALGHPALYGTAWGWPRTAHHRTPRMRLAVRRKGRFFSSAAGTEVLQPISDWQRAGLANRGSTTTTGCRASLTGRCRNSCRSCWSALVPPSAGNPTASNRFAVVATVCTRRGQTFSCL